MSEYKSLNPCDMEMQVSHRMDIEVQERKTL